MVEAILGFLLGVIMLPALIWLRAKRNEEWDDSNIFNIYRVIAHLMTRPGDFGKMYYMDGKRPFWYISEDEISEVVNTDHKP